MPAPSKIVFIPGCWTFNTVCVALCHICVFSPWCRLRGVLRHFPSLFQPGEDIAMAVPPVHPHPLLSVMLLGTLFPMSQQLPVIRGMTKTALSFMWEETARLQMKSSYSWILKYPLFSCLSNHEDKPTVLMTHIVWMIFSNLQQTPFCMRADCRCYFFSCSSRGMLRVLGAFSGLRAKRDIRTAKLRSQLTQKERLETGAEKLIVPWPQRKGCGMPR